VENVHHTFGDPLSDSSTPDSCDGSLSSSSDEMDAGDYDGHGQRSGDWAALERRGDAWKDEAPNSSMYQLDFTEFAVDMPDERDSPKTPDSRDSGSWSPENRSLRSESPDLMSSTQRKRNRRVRGNAGKDLHHAGRWIKAKVERDTGQSQALRQGLMAPTDMNDQVLIPKTEPTDVIGSDFDHHASALLPDDLQARQHPVLNLVEVRNMLHSPLFVGMGPRPPTFMKPISVNYGRVFKEDGKPARRKKGTDKWNYKATPNDTWDGCHGIRKRFGTVRAGNDKLRVHMYKLVQKVPQGNGWEVVEGAASVHHVCVPKEELLRGVLPPSGAVNIPEPQPQLPQSALLEMKLEAGDQYIAFQDKQGLERGSISLGPNGVYLSSTTGDFCEWHPRAVGEKPMEEGDLVGFDEEGKLTRRTTQSRMIGIITARGIVEGHQPPVQTRQDYHRVAYTGRVPVKVVGKHKPNDIIVPSGNNDGTSYAVELGCWGTSLCAGRIPDSGERKVSSKDRYELVDCIVINPSQTTGLAHRHVSTRIKLTAVFLTVVSILVLAVCARSEILSSSVPPAWSGPRGLVAPSHSEPNPLGPGPLQKPDTESTTWPCPGDFPFPAVVSADGTAHQSTFICYDTLMAAAGNISACDSWCTACKDLEPVPNVFCFKTLCSTAAAFTGCPSTAIGGSEGKGGTTTGGGVTPAASAVSREVPREEPIHQLNIPSTDGPSMINTGVIPTPLIPDGSTNSGIPPPPPGVVVGQPHVPTPMIPDGSTNYGIPPPPPGVANTYSGMQTSQQTAPTTGGRNVYVYSGGPHQTAPTRPTGNTYSGYSGVSSGQQSSNGYRPKSSGYTYSPSGSGY
jgi:hypothetical protein